MKHIEFHTENTYENVPEFHTENTYDFVPDYQVTNRETHTVGGPRFQYKTDIEGELNINDRTGTYLTRTGTYLTRNGTYFPETEHI